METLEVNFRFMTIGNYTLNYILLMSNAQVYSLRNSFTTFFFHLCILSFFLNVFNKIVNVKLRESVAVMNDIKPRQ